MFGQLPKFQPGDMPTTSPMQMSLRTKMDKENSGEIPAKNVSSSMAGGFRSRKPRNLLVDNDGTAVNLYREELRKVKEFKVNPRPSHSTCPFLLVIQT